MTDPCCDLHGRNCEQGGEECCNDCTEALHFAPGHGGVACAAPDLDVPRCPVCFGPAGNLTITRGRTAEDRSLEQPMAWVEPCRHKLTWEQASRLRAAFIATSAMPADTVLVGDFTEIARASAEGRPVNPKAFALLKLDAPPSDAALDLDPEVADG